VTDSLRASGSGPSLRDEHKARTKRSLREAALKLFASRGFDTTTIEEVAEQAGVSARTFFRYFPTKESVLFLGERDWVTSFADAYLVQPRSLSDVDAMCATIVDLARPMAKGRRGLQLYDRAVASSVALRGREQDHRTDDAATMAEAIAARRGLPAVDEGCILLATVGIAIYVRALDSWLAGPASHDLGRIIEEEFRILEHQFSRVGSSHAPTPERTDES
jgi:AcrR family transcriptional regulator